MSEDNRFLLNRFRLWLAALDQDKAEDEFVRLSDRAIARVFGVHHRLIRAARQGARWQDRNPLRRVWAAKRLEMEDMTAADIEAWDEAVKRGGESALAELERELAHPTPPPHPKPLTRAERERELNRIAKADARRAEFAARIMGRQDDIAASKPSPPAAACSMTFRIPMAW